MFPWTDYKDLITAPLSFFFFFFEKYNFKLLLNYGRGDSVYFLL